MLLRTVGAVPWVDLQRTSSYSLFGATGHGLGGTTLKGKLDVEVADLHIHLVRVYPAGWTHHLKAQGLPLVAIPLGATNNWVCQQKLKLVDVMETMCEYEEGSRLGGCRIEFKLQSSCTAWPEMQAWLDSRLTELLGHIIAHRVSIHGAISQAAQALEDASAAGVFSCSAGHLNQPCAQWRKEQYQRLLHRMGVVNKFGGNMALRADRGNDPWGPPPVDPSAPAAGPELQVNPNIPPSFPRVVLSATMSPLDVQLVGQRNYHLIDWYALAQAVGAPGLGATLEDVARHTKFRRVVLGRGRAKLLCFSANRLGGGTVEVLGDHLACAVVSLVARGLHLLVSRL